MSLTNLSSRTNKIVESTWFTTLILVLILINAAMVGCETSDWINARFTSEFTFVYNVILIAFIIEAILKMIAKVPQPWRYFQDGWNCFDFAIIVLSLVPAVGQLAMIARIARLLRIFRLISVFPQLRVLVTALLHSLPGMANVVFLMSVIFYTYGVAGYHLFHDIDPIHWKDLGTSLLSLFRIVTLEDWTDIMYVALDHHGWAWIYFVSFVVLATFVIINLFIGIVVTNVQEARENQLAELKQELHTEEIVHELQRTRDALHRVQNALENKRAS